MKGLKAEELRSKTVDQLASELEGERAALYNVRRQIVFGQVKDVMSVRTHRKNIAKIMTILHAKRTEAE